MGDNGEKVFEATISQSYHQVEIVIPGVEGETPQWGDGTEPFVVNDVGITVATRPDFDGDVTMRVMDDAALLTATIPIYTGTFVLPMGQIEVGNSISADTHILTLGDPGRYTLAVWVDLPEVPGLVEVVARPE